MNKLLAFICVYVMLALNVSALTTTRNNHHSDQLQAKDDLERATAGLPPLRNVVFAGYSASGVTQFLIAGSGAAAFSHHSPATIAVRLQTDNVGAQRFRIFDTGGLSRFKKHVRGLVEDSNNFATVWTYALDDPRCLQQVNNMIQYAQHWNPTGRHIFLGLRRPTTPADNNLQTLINHAIDTAAAAGALIPGAGGILHNGGVTDARTHPHRARTSYQLLLQGLAAMP